MGTCSGSCTGSSLWARARAARSGSRRGCESEHPLLARYFTSRASRLRLALGNAALAALAAAGSRSGLVLWTRARYSGLALGLVLGDPDGDALTYSITGGDDAALFTINPSTGELTLQAKTNGLATTDTDSLPITLTNMVDNLDGTFTADIEIDPAFASFAALSGFTIWFSTDNSNMTFTKNDITNKLI